MPPSTKMGRKIFLYPLPYSLREEKKKKTSFTCICIYVRAPSSKEPSFSLRHLERALNLLVPGASSTNTNWKLPSGRAALWHRLSMAQWRWCPVWARQTTGFLRQASRDNYNCKAHLSHSIEFCPSCCFLSNLFLQSPHTSGKKQIHAFTSMTPATPMYLSVQNAKNHSTSPAWGWRSANAGFPKNTTCSITSVVFHSPNDWLATARADMSSGYCCAIMFAWGPHSSAQLQTQMGWGFAEKPVFCLLIDMKSKIQLNLLRQ